ncbi:hypothetical protein GCM10028808_25790 [Spirosoma migulaei]
MKTWLLSILLLGYTSVIAQQNVYQSFEVDSAAEPRGGITTFNTFLQANLRKPIQAEAEGKGGVIVLSGVVEPDGHVSNLTTIKSLRPDCDREAMRVVNLFRVWKPAQKGGQIVRQQVSIPVVFKPNTPFIYQKGTMVAYFDANKQPVPVGSDLIVYRQIMPLDTNGLPTDDLVLYKKDGKAWDESYRDPFVREKKGQPSSSGRPVYSIGYQSAVRNWNGYVYTFNQTGKLMQEAHYTDGKLSGEQVVYYTSGMVAEKQEYADTKKTMTSWYPNGQIKQVQQTNTRVLSNALVSDFMTGLWDSTGRQMVKEGNGWAILTQRVKSNSDTIRQTSYVEQGAYQNGTKQGMWTGRYGDGSYFYEEHYNKGIFQTGKAYSAGADTVRYDELEQQPKFSGGMPGLSEFLQKTLGYPADAQRSGAQGKVFVSFVVCADGTLCDYEVFKSVHPSLDREAVRVVQKMSGYWTPGMQRGRRVPVKYNMPINFTLY